MSWISAAAARCQTCLSYFFFFLQPWITVRTGCAGLSYDAAPFLSKRMPLSKQANHTSHQSHTGEASSISPPPAGTHQRFRLDGWRLNTMNFLSSLRVFQQPEFPQRLLARFVRSPPSRELNGDALGAKQGARSALVFGGQRSLCGFLLGTGAVIGVAGRSRGRGRGRRFETLRWGF